MNRMQKIAWFNLIVISLALGLSIAAFGHISLYFRVAINRAAGGFGFIGIMGFCGLSPVLFRKLESSRGVGEDLFPHRDGRFIWLRVGVECDVLEREWIGWSIRLKLDRKITAVRLVVAPEDVSGSQAEPAVGMKQRIGPKAVVDANEERCDPLTLSRQIGRPHDLARRAVTVESVVPDDQGLKQTRPPNRPPPAGPTSWRS